MNYYWFNRKQLFQKANKNMAIVVVKKKLLNIMRQTKISQKKQRISIEICQKK